MNDFERKLRAQAFREPPADLRRTILAACSQPGPSWRDWLWPSPLAWGALAALWLLFFAVAAHPPSAHPSRTPVSAGAGFTLTTLLQGAYSDEFDTP